MDKKVKKSLNVFQIKLSDTFQKFLVVNVIKNITLGPTTIYKTPIEAANEEAMKLLAMVGLEEKANEFPRKLSGGQKQRLAIVRALAMNPKVMLFDEPTSALDAISEYELYNNFSKIIKDHSAIFISHRLSSTRFCDRIFYLDNGELKEVGSHDELMKKDGEYKKLFNMQAEYYKGGDLNEA